MAVRDNWGRNMTLILKGTDVELDVSDIDDNGRIKVRDKINNIIYEGIVCLYKQDSLGFFEGSCRSNFKYYIEFADRYSITVVGDNDNY